MCTSTGKKIQTVSLVIFLIWLYLTFFLSASTHAAYPHKEKEYQECWCAENGGVTEFVLPDRTRVDCLTEEYAIEFDFAENWAESIGQALYYAVIIKKKPGIVLILERQNNKRFVKR